MKNLKYIIVTAAIFVGCTDDYEQLILDNGKQASFTEITATFSEGADTRMGLSNDNHLYWSQSDVIGVYSDQQGIEKYANPSISQEGTIFRGEKVEGNRFFAFYPYSENLEIDKNDRNILHLSLEPSSANYQSDYGSGYSGSSRFVAPIVAKSSGNDFQFKHICGYLCLEVSSANEVARDGNGNIISGYTYRSLTLTGNNGEKLAGTGTVDMSADTPLFVVDPVAGETSVTTTEFTFGFWGNGIKLYIPLPEMTFEKGITARIELNDMSSSYNYNTGGYDKHVIEVSTDKPVVIERGKVKSMTSLDGKELFENSESERELLDIKQRKILKEFYDALDGDNWTNNTNWNSDKPLSKWYGLTTDAGKIIEINLWNNNIKGQIPASISELTSLQVLHLGSGNGVALTGSLPDMRALTNLETLDITGKDMEQSTIPVWIREMKQLKALGLQDCNLIGSIPSWICELTNLTDLRFSNNKLSGSIPSSISNLVSLDLLYLYNNNLTGSIPESIGYMERLRTLDLEGNSLEGNIPVSFKNLNSLETFVIRYNDLEGVIPKEVQESAWWNNESTYVGYSGNKLVLGDEDERKALNELYEATGGDSWNNNEGWTSHRMLKYWYGITTDNDNHVTRIDLDENNLTGMLPDVFSNFTKLTGAYFADNNLEHSSVWVKDGNGKLLYYTTQPAFLAGLVKLMSFGTLDISGNKINGCVWQQFSDAIYNTNENVWGKGNGQRRRITLKLSQQNGYGMYYQTGGDGGTIPVKYTLASFEYVVPNLRSSFQ